MAITELEIKGKGGKSAGKLTLAVRAPQYAGGGVVFGPKPRSYAQDMPRKQRRLALRSALSAKAQEGRLVVVETLEFEEPKTREFIGVLADSGIQGTVLVALDNHNLNAEKSARNLVGVKVILTRNLNVRDLLNHEWLLMTKGAVDQVGEVLA